MEPVVRITQGLYASDKTFETIPISKVAAYLIRHKKCYERTNPTEADPSASLNRVYIDLDGEAGDMGEREFGELVENITTTLKLGIEDACLMEASKHQLEAITKAGERSYKNKLSFRIQFLKKHGTKAAVKAFVVNYIPTLSELLKDYIAITNDDSITPRLNVDMRVYNDGRKMRMFGSSKDFGFYTEDRPNLIVSDDHEVKDTLITYIPEDSVLLAEPREEVVENVVVMAEPKPVKSVDPRANEPTEAEVKEQNTLLARAIMGLSSKYYDQYDMWLRVGVICFNEGLDFDVWFEFSKKSKHFQSGTRAYAMDRWRTFTKGKLSQASV